MRDLMGSPPAALAGRAVSAVRNWQDPEPHAPPWRGSAQLVSLTLTDDSRVHVRPSGTEPKLKLYIELKASLTLDSSFHETEAKARSAAGAVAEELVRALGLES
jgi:phosphomannomutase